MLETLWKEQKLKFARQTGKMWALRESSLTRLSNADTFARKVGHFSSHSLDKLAG